MKKHLIILTLIFSILIIQSCGDEAEVERLQSQNDSLKNVANESQTQLDQFMNAFNDIQQNLNTIKQKEHIIELNTIDSTEMTPDMKDQINSDIITIYELMQENKNALNSLKTKLKNSGIKNKQLQETIKLYENQMTQKDTEISELKEKLENMNFNMQELNEKITNLQTNIGTLEQTQEQQNELINKQDKELHTAFYVIGTKTELKDNKILTKDGILSKLSLSTDFDKSYFTKIDYRNIDKIPINSKKYQIITKHPAESYSIIENEEIALKITDKNKFWSMSKFLVIMLK